MPRDASSRLSPALLPLAPVLASAARAVGLPRTLDGPAGVAGRGGVVGRGGVAITFDDGPHPEGTPSMLEILAAAGARAAFFLVGEQVERRPELAARIAAAGHLVALHGYRHRLQLRLRASEVTEDLLRGGAAVEDATGTAVRWHRPPYGIYSPRGLEAAREHGLDPLLWSRWGKDWRKFTTPGRIAARATRRISAGDVILLHDADFYSARNCHVHTAAALPAIINELKRLGLDTVLPV